jgi:CRISPR-associated protein Cmr2
MSQSLLMFSIGPVQPFIAQARRAGDLAAGSWLISRLMQAALEVVEGEELLYPILPSSPEGETGLPNKLVVRILDGRGEAIAQNCEKAVQEAWQTIMEDVQNHLNKLILVDAQWQETWQRQAKSLPEIYWSVIPWSGSDDEVRRLLGKDATLTYGRVYTIANRAFETRKALRDAVPAEEPGEKCSVCGQRSALHRDGENARSYWAEVARDKQVTAAQLRPEGRERLCGVCAIKRFNNLGRGSFPSVSHMATAGFKARLLGLMQESSLPEELMVALTEHQAMLRMLDLYTIPERVIPFLSDEVEKIDAGWQDLARGLLRYDGDVLFPETFTPKRMQDSYGIEVTPEQATGARRKVAVLLEACQGAGVEPSGRYYAILMLDGDRMGQSLAAAGSAETHKAISTVLARFATEEVKRVVEEKRPGRVIYAGGDDVLALLPVEHALEAAAELHRVYQKAMAAKLEKPSTSAGVLFAHHLYPLDAVLRAVRQAEKTAKEGYNRDAVVIHLLKRSGADVIAGAGWADADAVDIAAWVSDVAQRFTEGSLSPKLAHLIYAEAGTLAALPKEAQQAELRRLSIRQAGDILSREEKQRQAEKLSEEMIAFAISVETRQREGEMRELVPALEIVARWLLIAAFVARPGGEA